MHVYSIKNVFKRIFFFSAVATSTSAMAQDWNPRPTWKDSYSVDGICYCDTNFDHGVTELTANTPIGERNVIEICTDIEAVLGEGPTEGRIPYNDIQCGNGPPNDDPRGDEIGCPGRVDIGDEGCNIIGPRWDLVSVYGEWPDGEGPVDPEEPDEWQASASNNSTSALLAFDGISSTRWGTGTAQAPGQYFEIDFIEDQTFDSIVLDTTPNADDYPRGYEVYVSSDGISWGLPIAEGAGDGPITTINFSTVSTQYLKIIQTGSADRNWWSIHELTISDSGSEPIDSVYDRSNWVVSASHSNANAGLAIDNADGTRWTTRQAQTPGQSFEIDLGEVATISAIELDSADDTDDFPAAYAVYVSSDGANWGSAVTTGVGNGAVTLISLPSIDTRYIKIEQTGSKTRSWWSIHDLNIYGEPVLAEPVGEIDRSGWSLSASRSAGILGNAIDGDVTTRWATTRQPQQDGQFVTIDMGQSYTINRVVLDSAASEDDHPRSYELFVSNDGSSWGSAVASGSGSTDGNTVIDFSDKSARYVQIVQTGSDPSHWWSIYELNIYNIQ